jgi:hypothetical protein
MVGFGDRGKFNNGGREGSPQDDEGGAEANSELSRAEKAVEKEMSKELIFPNLSGMHELLERKRQEYEERIADDKSNGRNWDIDNFKEMILRMLLERERVVFAEIFLKLGDEGYFTGNDKAKDDFILLLRAWDIIDNYLTTGGADVVGGTGLRDIPKLKGEKFARQVEGMLDVLREEYVFPEDQEFRETIVDKLEEYRQRLKRAKTGSSSYKDAQFKATILGLLLRKGRVTMGEIAARLIQEKYDVLHVKPGEDDEDKKIFTNAWLVIGDYLRSAQDDTESDINS